MIPPLTDDAVSRLPIAGGRAELLEEVVGASGRTSVPLRTSRRSWLVPVAAAAAVVALAAGTALHDGARPAAGGGSSAVTGPTPSTAPSTASSTASSTAPSTASPAEGERDQRVLVTAPGWRVDRPGSDGVTYRDGDATLEITRAPANLYAEYVEDREHIVDPPAPGAPVTVLDAPAQLWAYPDPDDFTVIRSVVDGQWMELRGQGLDEAAFRTLLDSLRLVSTAEFEQAMPARFVTADERGDWVEHALQGIKDASGVVFPHAALPDLTSVTSSGDEDPYQLGVDVAGSYACAWLADYRQATSTGDTAEATEAVRVLGTSRQWPVLQDMAAEGDFPGVVWGFADQVAAGRQPDGFQQSLGC